MNWGRAKSALELIVESAFWEHRMCPHPLGVPLEFRNRDNGQLAVMGAFVPVPGGRGEDPEQVAGGK